MTGRQHDVGTHGGKEREKAPRGGIVFAALMHAVVEFGSAVETFAKVCCDGGEKRELVSERACARGRARSFARGPSRNT